MISDSLITEAKILIIDDERANVRLLEIILEQAGYSNVFSTTDAAQVLPLCLDLKPDLLILDLHMPHFDGFEVIQILRADPDFKAVPILVLTADATVRARHRALAEGAQDFLLKPLDDQEALLRIRHLLEARFRNELLADRVREAQRFMRSIFDALPSLIVVLDQNGTIMMANRAWCDYIPRPVGDPSASHVGTSYFALWDSPADGDRIQNWAITRGIRQVLDGVTREYRTEYACHISGVCRWYSIRATPFVEGGPMRVVVTHEDITEHRYVVEELARVRSEIALSYPPIGDSIPAQEHDQQAVVSAIVPNVPLPKTEAER